MKHNTFLSLWCVCVGGQDTFIKPESYSNQS